MPKSLVALAAAALLLAGCAAQAASAPSLTFSGQTVTVLNAPAGQVKAKFYDVSVNTVYLGEDDTAPFTWSLPASTTRVQVRLVTPDARLEAAVAPGSSPTASPTASPTSPPSSGTVTTAAELAAALTAAAPGTTITLAPGAYEQKQRWELAASGTAAKPITLTGPSTAIITTGSITGNYGLHVTGSYWNLTGFTVANSSKGVVMDAATHITIDGITVDTIGDEGVHFRDCTTDSILRNSLVYDTGLRAARYGEGVYVGSANSNWGSYSCTDGRDNSERNVVTGNTFRDIPAEGADLKEGTDSGTLSGNLFDNAGFSGENSADSAVDAKGNNWQITGNRVIDPSGAFADAFQVHSVYTGYGLDNVFRGNTVVGTFPGFGFGLYPAGGTVVGCDNTAPGAASGLVGVNGTPAACTP